MSETPIIIEQKYDSSITNVWNALTKKEEMKIWYFDLEEFEPIVGFKFQFLGGPDDGKKYLHLCEVTEVVENKKLTYSWKYDGYAGISYLTFELSEKDGLTFVHLIHKDTETFPSDNQDLKRSNFVEGWTHILNISLKEYLEK